MRVHVTPSRPHVQGSTAPLAPLVPLAPLRLRHSAGELTDGGGLVLLRCAWDALGVGRWIDGRCAGVRGRYRPSLMIELWVALLLDSHVAVRYGLLQAGAEKGYNPKKPGRPSHHPLVAFVQETCDCLGVRWRPGSAGPAAGATDWIRTLVACLRAAGVQDITLRVDKGFFSREMVETLDELGVDYVLKVPDWGWVRGRLSAARRSKKDPSRWTRSGALYGARLLRGRADVTTHRLRRSA